jgi:hypothetical protein
LLSPAGVVAVDYFPGTKLPHTGAAGCTGGGDHVYPVQGCKLHEQAPCHTIGSMDEKRHARTQRESLCQHLFSCESRYGECAGDLPRHDGRLGGYGACGSDEPLRPRPLESQLQGMSQHAVSGREALDRGSSRQDDASSLDAECHRHGRADIPATYANDVVSVSDSRGFDLDQYLVVGKSRGFAELEDADPPPDLGDTRSQHASLPSGSQPWRGRDSARIRLAARHPVSMAVSV